ncbi:hypothetical protein N0V86_002636 [Didymella sp. IMI 355093]|nr:hypothetical protein N0V86_002636 [Didymella sp. IMI 355093]
MAPNSTPPKSSASIAGQPFEIFCDEHTPQISVSSASNAEFYDSNNENTQSVATLKSVHKVTPNIEPPLPSNRTPLVDVTQETVARPRSLSAALAEIAKLEDALKASKKQNQEMKGKIVAYQDALHQADVDMYICAVELDR